MTATTKLDWDRIGDAIKHPHRRAVLEKLYDASGAEPVFLGAESEDKSRVELVHNHLPKLESLGYVEWDSTTDTVRRGRRWPEIEPVVEMVKNGGVPDAAV